MWRVCGPELMRNTWPTRNPNNRHDDSDLRGIPTLLSPEGAGCQKRKIKGSASSTLRLYRERRGWGNYGLWCKTGFNLGWMPVSSLHPFRITYSWRVSGPIFGDPHSRRGEKTTINNDSPQYETLVIFFVEVHIEFVSFIVLLPFWLANPLSTELQ